MINLKHNYTLRLAIKRSAVRFRYSPPDNQRVVNIILQLFLFSANKSTNYQIVKLIFLMLLKFFPHLPQHHGIVHEGIFDT